MSGIQAALKYRQLYAELEAARRSGDVARIEQALKLSLNSWTRGAAQKGDVPAFTAARNSGSSSSATPASGRSRSVTRSASRRCLQVHSARVTAKIVCAVAGDRLAELDAVTHHRIATR